ncbi:hypothetical protein TrCOL_g6374 [Triparma columacea]|uniref:Uncharacterized protein n=1 Tax=Triparma columacea TaxID=722753 RepID=A0A9W7L663_9STRA|nr:hypothetical protein TrCOL_g6374 [Triparma columacea]
MLGLKPRVLVSYYGVNTTRAEGVTDLLRTTGGVDGKLIVRDLGEGRGTGVKGLVEVEIGHDEDVSEVLTSVVHEIPPQVAAVFGIEVGWVEDGIVRGGWGGGEGREKEREDMMGRVGKVNCVKLMDLANMGTAARHFNGRLLEAVEKGGEGNITDSRVGMIISDAVRGKHEAWIVGVVEPGLGDARKTLKTLKVVDSWRAGCPVVPSHTDESLYYEAKDVGEKLRVEEFQAFELSVGGTGEGGGESYLEEYEGGYQSPGREGGEKGRSIDEEIIPDTFTPKTSTPRTPAQTRTFTPRSQGKATLFGEGHEVQSTLFKALEERQGENLSLEREVGALQSTVAALQFERDELKTKLKGALGSTLGQRDRGRLRKALGEVRDYEVYKGVMEQALRKLKEELEGTVKERDRLRGKVERMDGIGRRIKKECFEVKKANSRMSSELEMLLAEKLEAQSEARRYKEMHADVETRAKAAAREVGRLRVENRELGEEAGKAKRRLSRVIVESYKGGSPGKAGGSPMKAGVSSIPLDEEAPDRSPTRGVSAKEWREGLRKGVEGGGEGGKRQETNERLNRAQGNLNAARKIMFT